VIAVDADAVVVFVVGCALARAASYFSSRVYVANHRKSLRLKNGIYLTSDGKSFHYDNSSFFLDGAKNPSNNNIA
jgi:hypothetical protein